MQLLARVCSSSSPCSEERSGCGAVSVPPGEIVAVIWAIALQAPFHSRAVKVFVLLLSLAPWQLDFFVLFVV